MKQRGKAAMLGLIGAMKIEMEQLLSNLEEMQTAQIGSMTFHAGSLWGRRAVLCVCGPGKVNAALCAQTMILTYHPEAVINLGVAGSLSGALSIAMWWLERLR
jgi:adenosylhomocysteine nucleosidase